MPRQPAPKKGTTAFADHAARVQLEHDKQLAAAAARLALVHEREVAAIAAAKRKAEHEAILAEAAEQLAAVEADLAAARAAAAEAEAAAARLAAEQRAAGEVAVHLTELSVYASNHPGLMLAVLEEFKSLAGRLPHSPMPDGAAVKVAQTMVWEQVADRVEDLEGSDALALDESDTEPVEQLQLTRAEWEFVKREVLAFLFAPRPRPQQPATSAPGSPARIEDMRARYEAGDDLYHPEDATPENTGRALATRPRLNGGRKEDGDVSAQVVGWADEAG